VGQVVALFVFPQDGGAAEARGEVLARLDGGFDGDHARTPQRAVTVLALEQWREALAEIGADLPPAARRANVVVSGVDLPETMGKRLRLGGAEIEVLGEVKPCHVMEETRPGLRAALTPGWRGGVHGRVVRAGAIRVGDTVEALAAP
jgi:MOSC domain-containing protein YiiM